VVHDANTQAHYPGDVVAAVLALATCRGAARQRLIGISGLQGSGKSTLAAQVVRMARDSGMAALAMSIDDFYLGRAARQQLARTVHPLLATRGVPGTHDVALLMRTLDALRVASAQRPASVPRFDKGRDTRIAPSRWRMVRRRPDLVILEGWCIGVAPQELSQLRRSVNTFEHIADADARWRGWVNAQLEAHYSTLWQRLDALAMLQAPDYAVVAGWRDEQERALRRSKAPRAMSPAALKQFLRHYERLSRHALATLPARADLRIVLDERRGVRRIVARKP
jgi:D-glycerate 3-kinase